MTIYCITTVLCLLKVLSVNVSGTDVDRSSLKQLAIELSSAIVIISLGTIRPKSGHAWW